MASAPNLLPTYAQSDSDEAQANTQYYGYINGKGSWYIAQVINAGGIMTYRYATGGGGTAAYATQWVVRNTLTYDYYANIFQNL